MYNKWQPSKGPPQTGFGGLVATGVAFEELRISAGSGRVKLSAAEHEGHWLRGRTRRLSSAHQDHHDCSTEFLSSIGPITPPRSNDGCAACGREPRPGG